MRYSNQLNDDFGDYVLRKQEWDLALKQFMTTNKTGCWIKNMERLSTWIDQNPEPKNPHAGPTWQEMSSKRKWFKVIDGLIFIGIGWAIGRTVGQFIFG